MLGILADHRSTAHRIVRPGYERYSGNLPSKHTVTSQPPPTLRIPFVRRCTVFAPGGNTEAMLLDQRSPEGKLAEVPRLMRVSMLFGYAHGTPIAARSFAAQGNAGLNALLDAPPISTRQAREAPVAMSAGRRNGSRRRRS